MISEFIKSAPTIFFARVSSAGELIEANDRLNLILHINNFEPGEMHRFFSSRGIRKINAAFARAKRTDGPVSVDVEMAHCDSFVSRRIDIGFYGDMFYCIGYDLDAVTLQTKEATQLREIARIYSHYIRSGAARMIGLVNMIEPATLPPEERALFDMLSGVIMKHDDDIKKVALIASAGRQR